MMEGGDPVQPLITQQMVKVDDGTKKVVIVHISGTHFCWTSQQHGISHTVELRSRQILTSKVTQGADNSILDVYFVKYVVNEKESVEPTKDVVTFIGPHDTCTDVHDCLTKLLDNTESHRPKRLLILVNPVSGWKKHKEAWTNTMLPLLDLCGVSAHIIETEHENHANEILATYDLNAIDAVIAMGGDGMTGQVSNALFLRTQADAKICIDDHNAKFAKCRVRFGVIPTGSVNVISYYLSFTRHVAGCTLMIILGNTTPTDAMVIHNGNKFIRQSNLDANFSSITHANAATEKLRWFKALRMIAFVPLLWFYWGTFDAEVDYCEVEADEKEFSLVPEAVQENFVWDKSTKSKSSKPGWMTYQGKFAVLHAINFKLLEFMRLYSASYTTPHMSSGKILLLLCKPVSFWCMMRELIKTVTVGHAYVKSNVIEQIEVTQFTIRLLSCWTGCDSYKICHDGDPMDIQGPPIFHIKSHANCFDMFCVDDIMVKEALKFSKNT